MRPGHARCTPGDTVKQRVRFPDSVAFELPLVRRRSREIAEYLEAIAEQPLSFRGAHPIEHSAANHCHLWMVEWMADKAGWIDLAFRVQATAYILGRWRDRLPSYEPARERGFRLYLYADMAPTVSVVAETNEGCPYGGDLEFVSEIGDVLAPYAGRSWMSNFKGGGPTPDAILSAAAREAGSLRRTATRLDTGLAELRRLIECYGIAAEFNRVRKSHGRRPAQFADPDMMLPKVLIWEWRVPPTTIA